MDKIIINGGQTKLEGQVEIEGAKNAVLPLLAATILPSEGETVLCNVPILSDVYTMNAVIKPIRPRTTSRRRAGAERTGPPPRMRRYPKTEL